MISLASRSRRPPVRVATGILAAAISALVTALPAEGTPSSPPPLLAEINDVLQAVCQPASAPPMEGDWRVTPEFCSLSPVEIHLRRPDGTELDMAALLARTGHQRQAGYQHIGKDVIARTAILFVFPQPVRGAFHMCNVAAALDIAWFDEHGALVDQTRMEPGPSQAPWLCPVEYSPRFPTPYRFALEVPAGFFARHGLWGPDLRLEVTP